MKKAIPIFAALAGLSFSALADITVHVSPEADSGKYDIEYGYLKDMIANNGKMTDAQKMEKTAENGVFTIETLKDGPAQYVIPTGEREYIIIYANPDEELTVNVKSVAPLSYSVTGSRLMEDISAMDKESSVFLNEYRGMVMAGNPDPEAVERLSKAYDAVFTGYIANNPEAAAVPYALLHLDGQDFMDAYNALTPAAKESLLFPFLEPRVKQVQKHLAAEQRMAQLQSGQMDAPDFTFKNAEGKEVSLSQFKGKWVIIDFWGTWCPWCIKGFPELKEAYATYSPELEIVGVACNDKYDAWLNGLKKYELPWVNLYNPEEGGGQLLQDYGVEGFPTKAIVTPEGKIANITVGHNPEFFNILKGLMGK